MSELSPDDCAFPFLGYTPDASRYNTTDQSPLESNDTITNLVTPGAKVLDVGCGIGAIGERLVLERRARVTGIEPDASRAEAARARGLIVHQTYLDERNVSNFGAFDLVTAL
jgi:2-polyprenyl-3-methyl-5-hydroxy-6-metoxy-1,4-benzoquinol methylase